ncbi:MAG: hypothetical protein ACI80V_003878, partial [Rhodothermales bacterium]
MTRLSTLIAFGLALMVSEVEAQDWANLERFMDANEE